MCSQTVTESGCIDFPTVPGRVLGKMITRYISGRFKEASDVDAMATLERVAVATMWEWYNHRANQDEAGLGGALGNPSPMPARVVRPAIAAIEVPVLREHDQENTLPAPGDVKEEDELDGDGSDMELSTPHSQATRDASPEVPLSRLNNTQISKAESPSPSERSLAHSSTERPAADLKTEDRENTPHTPMQSRIPSPPLPVTPGGAQDDDESASPANGVPGVFFELGSNKPPQLITLPPGFNVLDGPAFAAHAIASSLQTTMRSSTFGGRITSQAGVGAHRTDAPASKRRRPYAAVSRKVSDGEGTDRGRLGVGQAGPSRPKVPQHPARPVETTRQDDSDDDVVEVEKDSKGKWVPVTPRNTETWASENL